MAWTRTVFIHLELSQKLIPNFRDWSLVIGFALAQSSGIILFLTWLAFGVQNFSDLVLLSSRQAFTKHITFLHRLMPGITQRNNWALMRIVRLMAQRKLVYVSLRGYMSWPNFLTLFWILHTILIVWVLVGLVASSWITEYEIRYHLMLIAVWNVKHFNYIS